MFRTRTLGTFVSQVGDNLTTINGSELPRRVSFLLKGLIRRQKANLQQLAKNCFSYSLPANVSLPDLYSNIALTFCLSGNVTH